MKEFRSKFNISFLIFSSKLTKQIKNHSAVCVAQYKSQCSDNRDLGSIRSDFRSVLLFIHLRPVF